MRISHAIGQPCRSQDRAVSVFPFGGLQGFLFIYLSISSVCGLGTVRKFVKFPDSESIRPPSVERRTRVFGAHSQ